jgi:phosphoribosylaminoimidazolecarboxamide formyltransferase/IMP cyclohydrolase
MNHGVVRRAALSPALLLGLRHMLVVLQLARVGHHRGAVKIRESSAWALLHQTRRLSVDLRYGINPEQRATASLGEAGSPVRLLSGEPSYVNVLDAVSSWQLVREASLSLGRPVATSFKHVSPAGAALAGELDEVMEATWGVEGAALSAASSAYVRARDCDPRSSYGDFVAVSEPVDASLADVLSTVVSDGIIAPGFEPGTVQVLAAKKSGRYVIFEALASYEPPEFEQREIFGIRLAQGTKRSPITADVVSAGTPSPLPDHAVADLALAMITARYTQSKVTIQVLTRPEAASTDRR